MVRRWSWRSCKGWVSGIVVDGDGQQWDWVDGGMDGESVRAERGYGGLTKVIVRIIRMALRM